MQLTSSARTALGFALAVVFSWLFYEIWRRDRTQPAVAWWGAAHAVWAVSMLLFALRGTISPWVAIILGNIGLSLGYGMLWSGARQLSGQKIHHFGLFAGILLWAVACLLPGFLSSLPARVALSSATIAAYSVVIALVFREGTKRQRLPSHHAAIGALLAHGVVHTLRSACALILPFETSGTAPPEAGWNVVLTILAITLISSVAVLLLALARERDALASNAVLAASRDAAASASREKSRFLARMSHELRTPLNGVLGMAQVLARDPSLGLVQREQARTLERAGRHLLAMVNDVLDLARIEAGRLDLLPQPIRIRECLAETLDFMRGAASEKRLTLRLSVAEDVPRAVSADLVRLRQILLNLLGNAVKFTPEGGAVTLRAEWTPDNALRLTIMDNGPGVPSELRDSLFGEFNQGRREVAAGVGTGLGLAISSALARTMGGTLEYAPGPDGQGSTFSAILPLPTTLPEEELESAQGLLPLAPTRPLRLLVVDDVSANRMVARALLEAEGHLVEEAADGSAAIEVLTSDAVPDAVLMDIRMPGTDGYATTALIRRLEGPAARVPIIALTASAMPEDAAASRVAGMDGFLTKPLDYKQLMAELMRVLPSR